MPKTDPTYRLVVFDAPDDAQCVRDLVARVTGLHPTDAMRWVARAPGVFPQLLDESHVRPILDGLYDLGVAAEAWRADTFPDFSRPRTIHEAACLPDGLRIQGLRGEPTHWVPWDTIEIVSAGRILVDDEFRGTEPPRWTSSLVMGFQMLVKHPRKLIRTNRAMRIPRDPVGELQIVRRDPRIVFRVVANQMNYASLGDRLRPSSAENFPILVAAVVAQATDSAHITPATRSFLETATQAAVEPPSLAPTEHDFDTSLALLDYTMLQLLWSWYRRDRDSRSPKTL